MAGNLLGGPAPQSARERFPSPRLSAGVRAQREKAEPQTCPLPAPLRVGRCLLPGVRRRGLRWDGELDLSRGSRVHSDI